MKDRHKNKLVKDLTAIRGSALFPYIEDVVLYGSCARGEEKYDSDIDLLIQLSKVSEPDMDEARKGIRGLKSLLMGEGIQNEPETDAHFVFGSGWRKSEKLYYSFIQKEGISIWRR